jgi:NADPH:quinone reductase-like Zn-dependent oxidoreductase
VIDCPVADFSGANRDIDVVLDTIGSDTVERSLALLPGGHLVTAVAEEDTKFVARYEASGVRFSGIAVDSDPVTVRRLVAHVELDEQGRLRVHEQETFPFECVADGHRLLDTGHLKGKAVLSA